MADIGTLIDGGYVGINDEDCDRIPSQCYQTISRGRVQQTDSLCAYCCWKVTEVLKAFVLPLFYTLVLVGCSIYCWQIISNYIHSLKHPIETLSYVSVDNYEAPGIAVFMFDNATFVSCEKNYYYPESENENNKRSRRSGRNRQHSSSLSSLLRKDKDSDSKPCLFSTISSYNSVMARQNTSIMVFQGPSDVERREHMKIHFKVNQQMADPDIGFLEYFPFANFSEWTNDFNSSQEYLQEREKLQDIWPLAMGFTTYSRLSIRVFENPHQHNYGNDTPPSLNPFNDRRVLFNPVNDIVKYLPRDTSNYTPHYENMFAIFEWRDSEYEKIENVVTQNLITTVGLMVTAVLTLLRMTDLTKVILRRQRIRYIQNRLSFYSVCTCCNPNVD